MTEPVRRALQRGDSTASQSREPDESAEPILLERDAEGLGEIPGPATERCLLNSPAVAAIQQKLGVPVNCNFDPRTAQAVRDWQTTRGDNAVTGQIGPDDWNLLDVPLEWGADSNADGAISPSDVVGFGCASVGVRPESWRAAD